MSQLKLGAHPLVVAVALGLLGPSALVEDERTTTRPALSVELDEPSDAEFARVEALWATARDRIDDQSK